MTTATVERSGSEERTIEMMPGGQSGFFTSKARYPGLFGGVGGSKTFTGFHRAVAFAEDYPGARILVTEPTGRMVKDVLLPTIRQEIGSVEGWGWTLRGSPGDYDVVWHNGSVLMLRSALLMSPDMLSGLFLAAFWMDEVALGDQERTFRTLQARLRQKRLDGTEYPYAGWSTGTPRGMNWCYRLWGPGHKAAYDPYYVRTEDNPYLPDGYYDDLLDSYGDTPFARQELGGEFVAFRGLIYSQFSTVNHVQEPPAIQEFTRKVAGVDFSGGTSPSVIEVYGKLPSGRCAGIDEFYVPACPIEALVEAAAEMQRQYGISRFYCDPSGKDEMETMAKAGLPVGPAAVKDVNVGIKLVSSLLNRAGDGSYGVAFSSRQVYQIAEMYQYQWREQRGTEEFLDVPVKANDHCCDATRYALTALVEPPASRPVVASTRMRV